MVIVGTDPLAAPRHIFCTARLLWRATPFLLIVTQAKILAHRDHCNRCSDGIVVRHLMFSSAMLDGSSADLADVLSRYMLAMPGAL